MNQIWDHILYNQKSAKRCDENFLLRIRPRFPPNLSTRYKSPGLLRDRQVICIPKHSWITATVPGLAAFALLHRFVYWWKMRVNQRLSGLATDKRRGSTHSYDNETTRNWHNIDKGQILIVDNEFNLSIQSVPTLSQISSDFQRNRPRSEC